MSIRVMEPAYNPYAGLFGALGAYAGNRASEKQEQRKNQAAFTMFDIANQDPQTFADTRLKAPDMMIGGLLGGKPIQGAQPAQQANPFQLNAGGLLSGGFGQQQEQQPSFGTLPQNTPTPSLRMPDGLQNVPDTPAPTTRQTFVNKYRPQMQAIVKYARDNKMSMNDVMPHLQQFNQRADEDWKNYQTEQNSKTIGTLTEKLNGAKDLRTATTIAMAIERAGGKIHPDLIKAAYADPEYDIRQVDLGGTKKIMAVNKKNPNEVIDLYSGEATMTPYQTESLAVQREGNAIRAANGGRGNNEPKMTFKQKDEFGVEYQDILSDIWNSNTPEEREQKIVQHAQRLNALGEYLDKDVQNDVDYIQTTNPIGLR
jgi:hypothetical protein